LPAGTRLGPYEIVKALGAGGMGEVYRARDTRLDRSVAVKVLSWDSPELVSRFQREARAAAALNHPNIVGLLDVGTHEGVHFLVSELLEGQTLDDKLRAGPLPAAEAVEIALQILEGLAAAHEKGIVHRDLKPANLFVTNDGTVKILDFGIAKLLPMAGRQVSSATRSGALLGTIGYMSPEQTMGVAADHRSDIFSFGVVLYEMMGGQLSAEFDRIVQRCLERDPGRRFQSAREVILELESVRSRRHRGRYGIGVAVIALIAALAGLAVARWTHAGRSAPARSLAVLPLENLSGLSDQEYFADGLTDALITDLSQIHSLRVVSRTSAMGYKQTRRPLREIARALNAELIVKGSVVRDRDRVRVTAQLIDGATDRHLWARSYERNVRDVLNLQSEVARTIAREIRLTLTPQEEARLTAPRSVIPEAHEAYLMGRYAFNKRTEAGLKQALQYYQRAVDLDPGYAAPHAAIASTYDLLQFYAGFSPSSVFPQAKKAAEMAIQLDDSLPEAHAALAYVTAYYDWKWAAAEREFKRAIELLPNDADVYHRYSRFLAATGRVDEALENVRHAQELDPAPLIFKANEAITLYFARRYDRAIEQLRKVAELDPNFYVAYWGLGLCLEQRGDAPGAIAQFEKAVALKEGDLNMLAGLGHGYALAGRRGDALRILDRLAGLAKQRYVPSYYAATVHVALGDPATALDLLEQSYGERSTLLGYLKMDPRLDPLRPQPRFQALLSRIGL
jgi:serine/threonine-protein kinase